MLPQINSILTDFNRIVGIGAKIAQRVDLCCPYISSCSSDNCYSLRHAIPGTIIKHLSYFPLLPFTQVLAFYFL